MLIYSFIMKLHLVIYVTTLVLTPLLAISAPSNLPPLADPVKDSSEEVNDNADEQKSKLESMSVTDVPEVKKTEKEKKTQFFYPYKQSLAPRLAAVFDTDTLSNKEAPNYAIGLSYMLPSKETQHWEAHVDVVSNSTGRLGFASKWVFRRESKLRPHLKAGVTLNALPRDGLGSFLRWKQYEAYAAMGLEDMLKDPVSVRIDFEVMANTNGVHFQVALGYSKSPSLFITKSACFIFSDNGI